MRNQRFQEILVELGRGDFQAVLDMALDCFRQEHNEEIIQARFEVNLRFDWKVKGEEYLVGAEELLPSLQNLSEEQQFCLSSISVTPIIEYVDATGSEQRFKAYASTLITGCGKSRVSFSYDGNKQIHWKELHYRQSGGEVIVVPRDVLCIGHSVAQTPAGPLKVFAMGDSSLVLMMGTTAMVYSENREYLVGGLPGIEAGLYYDHKEHPALWSWLHIDDETEGKSTPSYSKYHEKKENIYEGMDFINNKSGDSSLPVVRIVKIEDRSITLEVGAKQTIVLDKPNCSVVIWQKKKRSLIAKIYVPEPVKRWSSYFDEAEPAPLGCRVTCEIIREGAEVPEFVGKKDIRTIPEYLKTEDYDGGVYWEWPYVWGFSGGKMVVGMNCPRYNNNCTFLALMPIGKSYTFPINDRDDDDEGRVNYGRMTVSWECVQIGVEIKDGELISVPDVEEFTVPSEVHKIHHQALLTAPSLRRIVIHQGVSDFSWALQVFHKERCAKVDVVYEGSLQQWFDTANGLAGHIGGLVIQGKEYDFYMAQDLVIPERVSRIGNGFFSDNNVLRSVVLPPEVVEIGDHAFAYCKKLQNVKVLGPATVGCSAFVSCSELSDVYLADGVVALEHGCFDFLTRVKTIFIPQSVKSVGRLSGQNDGSCMAPAFCCAAPSKPSGWDEHWNLAYFDPRFGIGHGYDYYHPVAWGCERE